MTSLPPAVLPGRRVLSLTGPDTVSFLQNLLTANVARLSPGEATHAALLTPQGKVLCAFFVHRTEEGVLLDLPPGQDAAIGQRLGLYKLRAKVQIEARGDLAVHVGDEGPDGAVTDPRLPALGKRWLAGPAAPESDAGYDARRLDLGVPEFGRDYEAGAVFPMDVNLDALGAVDYKKGCFVGQEVASRMFRKGEVRKRSWQVRGDALAPGAPVTAGGSTLGEVTSTRDGVGLALLRVDRVAAAAEPPMCGDDPVTLTPPSYLP
ncbi:YgfZ/GcvT domain-containing protein [Parvularcula dongshanensis]|uniref:CAF17 C-terminal domain-containing protein n=1 Tax=Parvularcula dongshanensis TaxID=1173995 RepID=A0A840I5C9_9PROT|nr:folate-binding protein YgfZ [Parvularcula dongshanensis]MBB4659592.1 hypothetical protein [Parvularcula dongshanensis]